MMKCYLRVCGSSLAVAAVSLLAGCERPPIDFVQHGYRGTAMGVVYNPRTVADQAALNEIPAAQPPATSEGPKAGQLYQNVKVLGHLSVAEFARHMVTITSWVAPKEGCTYCHAGENFADDSKYTKIVARRMIQMTQHINADWKPHVAQTGVTCYTCHRGQPVPAKVWFGSESIKQAANLVGDDAGQNKVSKSVADSSLPYDPFTPYLLEAKPIRVNGLTALPTGNRQSTKQAEFTYGLMMHMSDSLGVNCTYCHNSRAFAEWEGVPPQRATAWYGIRMARNLNNEYMLPLTSTFPADRLGPGGDVAKVNCATCHQGAYKPLYGKSMLADHPELAGPADVADTSGSITGTGDGRPGNALFRGRLGYAQRGSQQESHTADRGAEGRPGRDCNHLWVPLCSWQPAAEPGAGQAARFLGQGCDDQRRHRHLPRQACEAAEGGGQSGG